MHVRHQSTRSPQRLALGHEFIALPLPDQLLFYAGDQQRCLYEIVMGRNGGVMMEVNGHRNIFVFDASNLERSRNSTARCCRSWDDAVDRSETTFYCVRRPHCVGISERPPSMPVALASTIASAWHNICFRDRERTTSLNRQGVCCSIGVDHHPRAARGSMGAGAIIRCCSREPTE